MTTEAEGTDAIYARLLSVVNAGATAVIGYIPETLYGDQQYAKLSDVQKIHIRAAIVVSDRRATSIGRPKWYKTTGSLFVACNSPGADRAAATLARKLAYVVQNGFEGVSELQSLWYREVTVREVPTDGSWFQYRAEVRFELHELKG